MHSLTPHDKSLTIPFPSINHQSTLYSHYLSQYYRYLEQKIVHLVMNLRAEPHDFYLTRHGQSEYNAVGRIGGDSGLSKHGQKYAQVLGEWVEEHITRTTPDGTPVPARLWTSTMRRTYSVILLFFLLFLLMMVSLSLVSIYYCLPALYATT